MSLLDDEVKTEKNWTMWGGIVTIVLLCSMAAWNIINTKKIDPLTLCEVGKVSITTAILIDKTGGFTPSQKRIVRKAVKSEIDKLTIGERLSVYEIDLDEFKGLSKATFDSCLPNNGENANSFIENESMLRKKFNVNFLKKINSITSNFEEDSNAKTSPIIESLMDISTLYQIESKLTLKKLILISDLLQHSKNLSFYGQRQQEINSAKGLSLIPDLSDVDIQVYWLQRKGTEKKIQNNDFLNWWGRTFDSSLANDFNIIKVR
jgi:hypothetical protein